MFQRFEIGEQFFGVVALIQFLPEGHAAGSQIGRSLIRGVMGSLFGGGGSRKKSIW